MAMYKLKKEARQFFDESLHTNIKSLDFWKNQNIHENLLEKAENVRIEYGQSEGTSTHLCSWSSNDGEPVATFRFTIVVEDMSRDEYYKVKISDLLDSLQHTANQVISLIQD